MPSKYSAVPAAKKQMPMPGPASAAYKKIVAGRQGAAAVKPSKKRPKSSTAFSSLKARQQVVERVKRTIWASVLEINEAIINLALCGNYSAAKALFDFAGVYSLPDPGDDSAPAPAVMATQPATNETAASNPVDAFFKSIGIEPSCAVPEPATAA
jgi:hypothetical protein